MKTMNPYYGYAIIKSVEAGKSEGGLHLVGKEADNATQYLIVKASEGHIVDGMHVKCTLQPGDRVFLAPHKMVGMENGQRVEGMGHRVLRLGQAMPEGYGLIMLLDVLGYERSEETKH